MTVRLELCPFSGIIQEDNCSQNFSASTVNMSTGQKVVVIGAGPVGALAALYAANRGDDVEIYELRGGNT